MTFIQATHTLMDAFENTLMLFVITLVLSIPLGLVFTFGSMCRFDPVRYLSRVFVTIIRGTPLMLQLLVIMYVPGLMFGVPMRNRFLAASIAFVINYACYFSEIYRGGIESIDPGQHEAGKALGLRKGQIFSYVILPQVIKNVIPSMCNEVITLVKDTSLAQFIAYKELMLITWEIVSVYGTLWVLLYAGVIYFIFNSVVSIAMRALERKMDFYSIG